MINEYETTHPDLPNSPSNDEVISTINGLIQICKDGQDGFKQAAEGILNTQLMSVFYEFGQQRSQFVGELQAAVRELGGEPEKSGSFTGALHRGWIDIKAIVTGQDQGAILNECERGEDAAQKAYKEGLEQNLPSNVAPIVRRQYMDIQDAHNQVRSLRDSANNASNSATGGL